MVFNICYITKAFFFKLDLSCDLLKKIDNGTFSVTGDFFNAKVTYTCDKGFFLSGLKERICQGLKYFC